MSERTVKNVWWFDTLEGRNLVVEDADGSATMFVNAYPVFLGEPEPSESGDSMLITVTFKFDFENLKD
jgi:hypothetical protein